MVAATMAWLGANAATIAATATAGAAVAGAVTAAKGQEAAAEAQKRQLDMLDQQTKDQKDALNVAKGEALEARKVTIGNQRKQLLGTGDSKYNIGTTGATGVLSSGTYQAPMQNGSLGGTLLG